VLSSHFFVPAYFIVTKLGMDGRFSMLLLSLLFFHSH